MPFHLSDDKKYLLHTNPPRGDWKYPSSALEKITDGSIAVTPVDFVSKTWLGDNMVEELRQLTELCRMVAPSIDTEATMERVRSKHRLLYSSDSPLRALMNFDEHENN